MEEEVMRKVFAVLCVLALFLLGCASAEVKKAENEEPPPAPEPAQEQVVPKEPEPAPVEAEDREKFALKRIAIAPTLRDKEPADAGEVFPANVGKLHCFTHVVNADGQKQIVHKWYYRDTVVSKVPLKVSGKSWRTHSTKTISPGQRGPWRVEVLGPAGEVLGEARFEIK
jgi:Na+-transporting methylmalonyl-CoA/oxaloacetate decarboxylase gamma subunit